MVIYTINTIPNKPWTCPRCRTNKGDWRVLSYEKKHFGYQCEACGGRFWHLAATPSHDSPNFTATVTLAYGVFGEPDSIPEPGSAAEADAAHPQ
mgnify:CR=1 FL=1